MKIAFNLFFLLCLCKASGQLDGNQPGFVEYSIITKTCNNIDSWYEKKECSNIQILNRVKKELNRDILKKINGKKSRVWYLFSFNKDGELIKTSVKSNNDILKAEFERIAKKIKLDVLLIDKKAKRRKGRVKFPINLETYVF